MFWEKSKTTRCLNCFALFPARKALFQCSCALTSSTQEKFFTAPFFSRSIRKAKCPHASHTFDCRIPYSILRHCPKCLSPLHSLAGLVPETIFSIIGAQKSGKTEFLISLYQQLENHFPTQRFFFGMEIKENWNKITGATKPGFHFPPKTCYLTEPLACFAAFFDVSGKEWQKLSVENLPFLPFSQAYMLLCDPLANDKVMELIPSSIEMERDAQKRNSLKNILDQVEPLLKPNAPLALIITKSDLLRCPDLFDVYSRSTALVHFDHLYWQPQITQVATWYMKNFEPAVYHRLEKLRPFHPINYFIVSSFGQPEKDQIIGFRKPIRVSEPFLWCLEKLFGQ